MPDVVEGGWPVVGWVVVDVGVCHRVVFSLDSGQGQQGRTPQVAEVDGVKWGGPVVEERSLYRQAVVSLVVWGLRFAWLLGIGLELMTRDMTPSGPHKVIATALLALTVPVVLGMLWTSVALDRRVRDHAEACRIVGVPELASRLLDASLAVVLAGVFIRAVINLLS